MADSIQDAIQANLPAHQLYQAVHQLTQATRLESVLITCKHCRRAAKYNVETHDRKTALDAMRWLGEQGYGKATTKEQHTTEPVDTNIDPKQLTAHERAQLRARLTAAGTTIPSSNSRKDGAQ